MYTTGQIDGWNDSVWSNAQYDKLYEQQAQTLDAAKRKPIIDQMAQIYYDSAPYIVTNYEQQLEAYNTAKWTGWTHAGAGGPVAFENDNVDTYMNLRPKAATTATSSGGGNTLLYVGVVVILVLVGAVVLLVRRRGARTIEE